MPNSYAEVIGTQICVCESLHISVQNFCSQATYKIKGNVFLVHVMKNRGSSTHSYRRLYVEVIAQLHAPVSLPPQKKTGTH